MGAFPHIRYAAKSDTGRKRTNNEDAFGAFPSSGIYCVADGMGGGDDGEVASAATIEAVERFTKECPVGDDHTYPIDGIVSGVRTAVNSASAWIAKRTLEKGLKSCGSTFVGICFDAAKPNTAIALHAGDSRLYRIRGRSIEQITVDHSAAELIGAKNEKDVNPMFRGMILRAVGIQPSVELERTEVQLKVHDRILICSDGLSRMVGDRQMLSIIRAGGDLEQIVDSLVAAANEAGGIDNITVELIEVGEFPPPLPTSPLSNPPAAETDLGTIAGTSTATITQKTKDGDSSGFATTENDFIPSTAGDGIAEKVEEELNIPESDTEDNPPDAAPVSAPTAKTPGIRRASRFQKFCAAAHRLLANRFAIIGLAVALILVCCIASCAYSRSADEARAKSAAEAKKHAKEQKGSLETVEAMRKNAQEQKEREAEKERKRAEIETHEKQKELDEKARKAAERREREERAARQKAEADAAREKEAKAREAARQEELRKAEEKKKRKAEEEKKRKAEAEARERARREAEKKARKEKERLEKEKKERQRLEAERLAKLRKAEEDKKRKAAEEEKKRKAEAEARERAKREAEEKARKEKEAKALAERQEQERKAQAAKLERERKEKAAQEKQDRALKAFADVVEDGTAAKFHTKIKKHAEKSTTPDLHTKLSRAGNSKLSRADRIAAIVSLTKELQQAIRELRNNSPLMLEDIDCFLEDAAKDAKKREALLKIRDGLISFDREAGDFIDSDATEPDVQLKCVGIVRSVVKLFDF